MYYEVIWDVEDEVFGGKYSLRRECATRSEAEELARELRNDFMVSNIGIYDPPEID